MLECLRVRPAFNGVVEAEAPIREPDPAALPVPLRLVEHETEPAVGVGPWVGPWPPEPHYDPQLLAEGDSRNVVDRYRYWRLDAIVADLDTRRHPFHVAIENWQHDLNIGTVVRNANAFLAAEVPKPPLKAPSCGSSAGPRRRSCSRAR